MKKYFSASVLAVLLMVTVATISFVVVPKADNLISGMVTTQVFIYESPPEGCAVNLSEGVNMVSFFCVTGERFVGDSMVDRNNATLDYYALYKYNPANPSDAWDSYNPDLPNWTIQNLERLNRRHGYVIIMNSSGEFFRDGYRFSQTDIEVEPGWNFIGYPSDNWINITEGLENLEGMYTQVEAYTPVNGTKTWLIHTPPANGTLENLTPMVGYWIYMNERTNYTVDW